MPRIACGRPVNGDVYVAQRNRKAVARYNSSGAPDNFTAGPDAGSNKLTGQSLGRRRRRRDRGRQCPQRQPAQRRPLRDEQRRHRLGLLHAAANARRTDRLLRGLRRRRRPVQRRRLRRRLRRRRHLAFRTDSRTTPISNADYIKTGIHRRSIPVRSGPTPPATSSRWATAGELLESYSASEFDCDPQPGRPAL